MKHPLSPEYSREDRGSPEPHNSNQNLILEELDIGEANAPQHQERNPMTHQLINFNIPTSLKDSLDEIAKAKRLSRTAIINQLLETYCRTELERIASEPLPRRQQLVDDDMPLVPFLSAMTAFLMEDVRYDGFQGVCCRAFYRRIGPKGAIGFESAAFFHRQDSRFDG